MTDPSIAMQSFQQELLRHKPKLRRGELDKDLYVYVDAPHGEPRFTYVRLEGKMVTAFVELASVEPIEGTTCVALGYAVPEAYRRQGRAKEAVKAAIAEMQHGLGRNGISVFYVEAIVGADNKPSQRIAEQVISDAPVAIADEISGLPAFRYVRRVEPK
jgi:RimJ/RimL family protein N-acetyltransferase